MPLIFRHYLLSLSPFSISIVELHILSLSLSLLVSIFPFLSTYYPDFVPLYLLTAPSTHLSIPTERISTHLTSPHQVASREMIVSYLDEDLLILRDSFGSPEILRRKSMEFKPSSEPYSNMDSMAPSA